ncbi:MAG: sialate O-acetylesterase [Puniceicoccaceae bacterium]
MRTLLTLIGLAWLTLLSAEISMPAVFSEGMVLQQGKPVKIWGWANSGEPVRVSFREQVHFVEAHDRRWEVSLEPMPAGGPDELVVEGYDRVVIGNVLVGEVWLASGQSNMVWTVEKTSHAEETLADADEPMIRIFKVKERALDEPEDDVEGEWLVSTPENMASVSAVAYLFAREIHSTQDVPVGILLSARGGTRAVNWTSEEVLEKNPDAENHWVNYRRRVAQYPKEWAQWVEGGGVDKAPQSPTRRLPSGYFNGMVNGLIPYTLQGAIWYQGETDSWNAEEYVRMFPDLIVDWRTRWDQGDFPFYYVQLASYNGKPGVDINYPHIRDIQLKSLEVLPNLGMAVAIDAGEELDIHPADKRQVAHRLALLARNRTYGESLVDTGPMMKVVNFAEGQAIVTFTNTDLGLQVKGETLNGFALATGDGPFHPAMARIEDDKVIVWSELVPDPDQLRYAFRGFPEANLYNGSGLPASPFRTDKRPRGDDAVVTIPE